MKGQLPPQYLMIIGFILLCVGLFDMQSVVPLEIPYIGGYGNYLLAVGFVLIGTGMFGMFGLAVAGVISVLALLSGVL